MRDRDPKYLITFQLAEGEKSKAEEMEIVERA